MTKFHWAVGVALWSLSCPIIALADELTSDFQRASNKELLSEEFTKCVRQIRAKVVAAARETSLRGDERTEYLVQAAGAGCNLPPEYRARALILGLTISFDSTDAMRESVLTRRFWERYETKEEQKERLAILGEPTMHGRADWATHFFIAAGLTALTTPGISESMCILKEVSDANGGTGFSFRDMGANLAGIVYAERMITRSDVETSFVREFRVNHFLPPLQDLPEGVMIEELRDEFSFDSRSRFKKEIARIRDRVLALPVHRGLEESISAKIEP